MTSPNPFQQDPQLNLDAVAALQRTSQATQDHLGEFKRIMDELRLAWESSAWNEFEALNIKAQNDLGQLNETVQRESTMLAKGTEMMQQQGQQLTGGAAPGAPIAPAAPAAPSNISNALGS